MADVTRVMPQVQAEQADRRLGFVRDRRPASAYPITASTMNARPSMETDCQDPDNFGSFQNF